MAAPRATIVLAYLLVVGVLVEAAFAGGFVGGHHMWKVWHENLGDFLVLFPLANLVVGLALRRRHPESRSMVATRVVLLLLVVVVVVTGHAGGTLLAIHIPAAVATAGLLARQVTIFSRAQGADTR
jgi:hypothetical protein